MRLLKNVLYITMPEAYLSLDGENVVILSQKSEVGRVPLHNINSIITFGYSGISPALMGKCADYGIEISLLTKNGRFLGRVVGKENGNVLLRKEQYRISDDAVRSNEYAKCFVAAKIYNCSRVLDRAVRDYSMRIDTDKIKEAIGFLKSAQKQAYSCDSLESLRGIEGEAASVYFGVFDEMILQQKDSFYFRGRNRRPPLDRVNALLSFTYTLIANEASSALSSVGLDSYVGFLHRDKPGRQSLALDLMEEFRSIIADRFVLSVINKRIVKADDFIVKENGAVIMTDDCRRNLLKQWQTRKTEEIKHPFAGEKIKWGIAVFVQAQLLARCIRGDLDAYPAFLWK